MYVSSNTHSMALIVNGGTPQIFALTPSTNPNCSVGGGATICSNLQAVAAPGTDSFEFAMYQQALPLPPSPTTLSIATVNNEVVSQGVANQLGTFTLNPVLGSLALSVAEPTGGFMPGTSSSGNAISIAAKDPSGATIIGPGYYVNASGTPTPLSLTSNQTPFTFSVNGAAPSVDGIENGPSDSATLAYSGTSVGAPTIISAGVGSLIASQTISTLTKPISVALTSSAPGGDVHIVTGPYELDFFTTTITGTVALSELGYAGTFTLNSTTCGSWVAFSPGVGSTGALFTVTAAAAGSSSTPAICTATFGDMFGQTVNVTFSVTTIGFNVQ